MAGAMEKSELWTNRVQRLGAIRGGSILSTGPHYIAASKTGDKIFIFDFSKDTVIYQYKDKYLKGPKGVYCDDGDNVLVCGYGSNNVKAIDASGKKAGAILFAKDGFTEPISIEFRGSDKALIVGFHDRNKILVQNLVTV